MRLNLKNRRTLFLILTVIVFAAGIWLWMSDLSSDPPMYYSGRGQSLGTDPYQYSYHARNKILYDDFDPFDYPRWTVYQHSLTSLTSYILFSISGVSRTNANTVGLFLSLAGLLFFLIALKKHHHPWVLGAVALSYLVNVTLIIYGRLPYLENGLIFWAGAIFLLHTRHGHKLWANCVTGLLVAAAMLTGKLFGALLLPAVVLSLFFSGFDNRMKLIGATVAAFTVSTVTLIFILYGSDYYTAFTYVGEQSVALHGLPTALQTPWDYFAALVTYGRVNLMYYRDPALLLYLITGGGVGALMLTKIRSFPSTLRLAMFWSVVVILAFASLNYSPLRYTLLLIPGLIIFCFTAIEFAIQSDDHKLKFGWPQMLILFLLSWSGLFHLLVNALYFNQIYPDWFVWALAPGAALIVIAGKVITRWKEIKLARVVLLSSVVVILALTVTSSSFRYHRAKIAEHTFDIDRASLDIAAIVGPGAVISGPYAPTITAGNDLKCFIHLFGVAWLDKTLFERYPITHLALDGNNYEEAVKAYPELRKAIPLTSYWIRDIEVKLLGISKIFDNPQANSYEASGYEKAIDFYRALKLDSSAIYAQNIYKKHPESKSAGLLVAQNLYKKGKSDETLSIMQSLAQRYPTDFDLQLRCAQIMQTTSYQLSDKSLNTLAMKYYEKTAKINRYKANRANKLYSQIKKQFEGR